MEKIQLYTSPNCPACAEVKLALDQEEIPYTVYSTASNADTLIEELDKRDFKMSDLKRAPAMIVPGCDLIWTGEDCLIAIEEREWE